MSERDRPIGADLPTAPAAERNKGPILEVLRHWLPDRGLVLELASGTGQHASHFAAALPGLEWQPSDPDPGALETIAARVRLAALPNLREPLGLDVLDLPWPTGAFDALVCINMLHISPWETTRALFEGAGAGLRAGGTVLVYGPFSRNGVHTAASNEAFHRQLQSRDSRWGIRSVESVADSAARHGFSLAGAVPMPANNLCLMWRRAGG